MHSHSELKQGVWLIRYTALMLKIFLGAWSF
jgi:hypothetical protein